MYTLQRYFKKLIIVLLLALPFYSQAAKKTSKKDKCEEALATENQKAQKPEETTDNSTAKTLSLPSDQVLSYYSIGISDYNETVYRDNEIRSLGDLEKNRNNVHLLQSIEEISNGAIKEIPSKQKLIELWQDSKKRLANGEQLMINIEEHTGIAAVLFKKT